MRVTDEILRLSEKVLADMGHPMSKSLPTLTPEEREEMRRRLWENGGELLEAAGYKRPGSGDDWFRRVRESLVIEGEIVND